MIKKFSRPYHILKTDEILKQRNSLISSIANEDYCLSEDEAILILMYFQWNKEDFDLFWWDDMEGIREKSGLEISETNRSKLAQLNIPDSTSTCLVCYSDENLKSLSCGHHFCSFCWTDYLKVKSEDFLITLSTTCLQEMCPLIVPESFFFKYLGNDQAVVEKVKKAIFKNFLADNKYIKVCPSPKCNLLIDCLQDDTVDVVCDCGKVFCFVCEKSYHRPVDCKTLQQWDKKNSSTSEGDAWVKANCKVCPHCNRVIQRSYGCNYIYCDPRAGGCGKAFCYNCEQDWEKHTQDHFGCNKYTPENKKKDTERSRLKQILKKYNFFFKRYANYKVAINYAEKLKKQIPEIQALFTMNSIPKNQLAFLEEAIDCVISTKNTLMNSYIFGYYLKTGKENDLFVYNQADLERNCDNLHLMVEYDSLKKLLKIEDHNEFNVKFQEFKIKIINLTKASRNFQEGMIKHVETTEMRDLLDYTEEVDLKPEEGKENQGEEQEENEEEDDDAKDGMFD